MAINQNDKRLTGAHLKWIAIVLMMIDHIGAVLLEPILLNTSVTIVNYEGMQQLYRVYMVLRGIGRFSFPAFCFLLVEGFYHTRSKAKYLRNLLIFAVISEVPFNLAIAGDLWSLEYQNVFFTLAAGFVAIWIFEYWKRKGQTEAFPIGGNSILPGGHGVLYQLLQVVSVLIIALAAEWLHTDYGAVGVVVIFVLYAMHDRPVLGSVFAWIILSLSSWLEIFCFPFIFAVMLYNGQRGRQAKFFFYVFYPVHLMVLVIVRYMFFSK